MNLWTRIKRALADQRGEINWGDFLNDAAPSGGGGGGGSVGDFSNTSGSGGASAGGGSWFDGLKNWFGSSANAKGEGGSGAMGFMSDLGGFAKSALPLASVGTGIMGIINQQQALKQAGQARTDAKSAQDTQLQGARGAQAMAPEIAGVARKADPLGELAAQVAPKVDAAAGNVRTGIVSPVQEFATDRLKRANEGQIPPAIEAQIQQWGQQAKMKMLTFLANSGQDNSSAREEMEREIDSQMQAKRAQYLQDEETQALGAFDQARTGEATAGSLYGSEVADLGAAGQIFGAEAAGLGGAANALTGSSAAAGGAAANNRQEEQMLLQLIAGINQALAKQTAGAS